MRASLGAILLLSCSIIAESSSVQAAQVALDYGIEKVWNGTLVYPPNALKRPFYVKLSDSLGEMADLIKTPVPAVIYLHGCGGFKFGYTEAAYPLELASAGFAVFVPDSYARGPERQKECGDVKLQTIKLRHGELKETLKHVAALTWVDSRNLFLVGNSEGGMATAMYGGGEFRAYYISGWTCTSTDPFYNRIHIPLDKPVISVLGEKDEYYVGTFQDHTDCGMRMKGRSGSRSIVIKDFGHDVSLHPDTIPTLINFLKDNMTN